MARFLWLADVLRGAGLTVHEYEGWKTRGSSTYGPVTGIVCHGTGGSLVSTDAGELRVIAVTGSNTASAPIAQLYLSRTGEWWVVASGTCTGVTTGTAGPLKGLGDDSVLQIEAQHAGGEPWTPTQYDSYVRGVAALVAHKADSYDMAVGRVVGHYEHQPLNKTDPWFDMVAFRRAVASIGVSMFEQNDRNTAQADTWRLLTILEGRPAAEYQLQGEPAPRNEPNMLKAQLDRIEQALVELSASDGSGGAGVAISDEQLERVLRRILSTIPVQPA